MFTSKRTNAKKANQRKSKEVDKDAQYTACAKAARAEYDTLVKQRQNATSEKKIARLDEQIGSYAHVSEINAMLKFHSNEVISNNVTFGKFADSAVYGFTCVVSKNGDKDTVPVETDSVDSFRVFTNAKSMVSNGTLVKAFKTLSRQFVKAEIVRIEDAKAKTVSDALKWGTKVADDADKNGALNELMAVFAATL